MNNGPDFYDRSKDWRKKHPHHPPPPFPPSFGGEISKMVRGVMEHVRDCFGNFKGWVPYDVEEFEGYYVIKVPLPGLTKEDVKVSLINGTLNISTSIKKKEPNETEQKTHGKGPYPFMGQWFSEIWERPINVDIPLPVNANKEAIKSIMKNGLLKIKIEKKPPKRIDVESSDSQP